MYVKSSKKSNKNINGSPYSYWVLFIFLNRNYAKTPFETRLYQANAYFGTRDHLIWAVESLVKLVPPHPVRAVEPHQAGESTPCKSRRISSKAGASTPCKGYWFIIPYCDLQETNTILQLGGTFLLRLHRRAVADRGRDGRSLPQSNFFHFHAVIPNDRLAPRRILDPPLLWGTSHEAASCQLYVIAIAECF